MIKADELRLGPAPGTAGPMSRKFFRGLFHAILFSLPFWAGLAWMLWR